MKKLSREGGLLIHDCCLQRTAFDPPSSFLATKGAAKGKDDFRHRNRRPQDMSVYVQYRMRTVADHLEKKKR